MAEVLKETQSRGPLQQLPLFVRAEAGGDIVLRLPRLINARDHAVAGASQVAGACQDFVQNRIEIKARVDTQNRCAQSGQALAQHLDLRVHLVGFIHLPEFRFGLKESSGARAGRLSKK